jgi:anti-sigma factor RsiW
MNSLPLPEDLLSAYLDGELSPADQRRVEQALNDSAELQVTCRDFREIGAALRSLPREQLPADFSSGVMQGIERRMLLAANKQSARSELGSGSWFHSRSGRLTTAVACAAGLAAMLLVVLRGPAPVDNPSSLARNDIKSVPVVTETALGNGSAPRGVAPVSPTPEIAATNAVAKTATGEATVAPAPTELKITSTTDPKSLVGRIVEAYDPQGVTVVKVYVVDYDATWERLQVVLEEQAFATSPGAPAKQQGELLAVLAEGTPAKISEALAALAKEQGVLELGVAAEPLHVASLDKRVQAQFGPFASARPSLVRPGTSDPAGSGTIVRSTAPRAPLSVNTPAAAPAIELEQRTPWARSVTVPGDVLSRPDSNSTTTARSTPTPDGSVQVLFVLEQATNRGSN